jgi:hypothetical protein
MPLLTAAENSSRSADRPRQLAGRRWLKTHRGWRGSLLREEQARWFTLAWPILRRCGLRVGDAIRESGRIERAEDVFFLRRAELRGQAPASQLVSQRRAEWERQRRLLAPLTLGIAPRLIEASLAGVVNAVREPCVLSAGSIVGQRRRLAQIPLAANHALASASWTSRP